MTQEEKPTEVRIETHAKAPITKKPDWSQENHVDALLMKAKQVVCSERNKERAPTDWGPFAPEDFYIVWFSKTLQNWKALVASKLPDDIYYEVTYSGDRFETYLDTYVKVKNVCISDMEN